ncbi:MAG: pyrroline-5-carboxylate reductase, partial [Candidatus Omnitrophica bacterium]|nr:pyrroline-5-carboxylate reductase [Candidatus Omnitrophota bacterium]
LVDAGVAAPGRLLGADPSPARRAALRRLTIHAAGSNVALARASEILLLAVKPQEMPAVLREIAPALSPAQLVISIAAGRSTRWIERRLPVRVPVVRAMPNMPAQIGQGITVLCRGRAARPAHVAAARAIFRALGETLELPERHFHAVTALSGSGPAYVFSLMEAMLAAGRRLKVPAAALERLVRHTVLGSAQLAACTGEPPAVLRARVTSKGGTTEAALRTFERSGVQAGVVAGIRAAARRSAQLEATA